MNIFLQLALWSLAPVAMSAVFYLLKRKTAFYDLPQWLKQLIIGLAFGGVAMLSTEYGVDVGGATANVRDAAPLCAGIFFGWPAGLIAGAAGAVHRWFSDAGEYSRVACTVSTMLAGVFAGYLRMKVFEKKRPSLGFAAITGVVMEVAHLTILFVTHFGDSERALGIVKIVALPMIGCNAAAILLTTVLLKILSHEIHRRPKTQKSVLDKIQRWLLVAVVLAYLATTAFVYALQTGTAVYDANSLLYNETEEVASDADERSASRLLNATRAIALEYSLGVSSLDRLMEIYEVSEINIVSPENIITGSTVAEYVGFDMDASAQSSEFSVLNNGTSEYIQDFGNISFDSSDSSRARRYAGVSLEKGGYVQAGYDREAYLRAFKVELRDMTRNHRIGDTGFVIIFDENGNIISNWKENSGATAAEIGLDTEGLAAKAGELESGTVYGAESKYMSRVYNGSLITAVLPDEEVYATRDGAVYVNSFVEVLLFAVLFFLVNAMVRNMVVDKVRLVNDSMDRIIGGDLDEKVDVKTSAEFTALSGSINSTVDTLKDYIDQAAAKIDEELAFAKNIQHSAIPTFFPPFPKIKEFSIYATMDTAKEVGGDFYDFYMVDAERMAFLIADVSGKGIPAAMFMMRAKTLIKGYAESGRTVAEVLSTANEELCAGNDAGMFVTAWFGILELKTGHVTFANAGHNPPLLFRKDTGRYEYFKSRPGLVLAGMDGICYRQYEFDMNPGDKIYLYTDGVTEANNRDRALYGEDRLKDLLNADVALGPEDTLRAVRKDIDAFADGAEQFDDITMLMLEYKGSGEAMVFDRIEVDALNENLGDVTAFVDERLENAGCPMKTQMQIDVSLEELFVNVCNYAYPGGTGKCAVETAFDASSRTFLFRISDSGIPFDPLAKSDPDVTLSASERKIGGLGIFMVKKSMDDVSYEYKDGRNITTCRKKI